MSFAPQTYLQVAAALVFVLALIGLLAVLARRFGLGGHAPARRGRRRLALVEVIPLDAKRRLALVRRDDVEHLLVLGPTGEQVVESGIASPASDFAAEALRAAAEPPTSTKSANVRT